MAQKNGNIGENPTVNGVLICYNMFLMGHFQQAMFDYYKGYVQYFGRQIQKGMLDGFCTNQISDSQSKSYIYICKYDTINYNYNHKSHQYNLMKPHCMELSFDGEDPPDKIPRTDNHWSDLQTVDLPGFPHVFFNSFWGMCTFCYLTSYTIIHIYVYPLVI